MTVNEYQYAVQDLIVNKLNLEATCEWNSKMNANIYAPRLDIAIGPFSILDGTSLQQEYDHIYDTHYPFIYQLVKIHLLNIQQISADSNNDEVNARINEKIGHMKYFNFNSRCFIAVEIENEVSRKHLMGGALNASVLGRVAIASGFTAEKHRAFLNLYRYFEYLQNVEKPTFRTENLLIISAEQLLNVLIEL
ncbi:hypothetical protein D3C87_130220 [compost metagenome]